MSIFMFLKKFGTMSLAVILFTGLVIFMSSANGQGEDSVRRGIEEAMKKRELPQEIPVTHTEIIPFGPLGEPVANAELEGDDTCTGCECDLDLDDHSSHPCKTCNRCFIGNVVGDCDKTCEGCPCDCHKCECGLCNPNVPSDHSDHDR